MAYTGRSTAATAVLIWDGAKWVINSVLTLISQGANPATPATGVTLYSRNLAGRAMSWNVNSKAEAFMLQDFLGQNSVSIWKPPGNAATVPAVFGMAAYTAVGTATARNVATTSYYTRRKRLGYVGAAVVASLASVRVANAQYTVGDGAAAGGFFKVIRFGCSDAATVAGARQFVGVSSSTGAATNVEPSTLINSIGVGHGAADTNLFIYYGGSVAQAPINCGGSFPANTLSVDVYELALYSYPGSSTEVFYQLTRLNTGDVFSGSVTGTAGTAIPASTTLLSMTQAWRSNNASALAVGIDIFSDYMSGAN